MSDVGTVEIGRVGEYATGSPMQIEGRAVRIRTHVELGGLGDRMTAVTMSDGTGKITVYVGEDVMAQMMKADAISGIADGGNLLNLLVLGGLIGFRGAVERPEGLLPCIRAEVGFQADGGYVSWWQRSGDG